MRLTALFLLLFLVGSASAAQEPIQVGMIFDGPQPEDLEGSDRLGLARLVELVQSETVALTRREFQVEFPTGKRIACGWEMDRIRDAVDRMLADPEVDIVLTAGVFATNEVSRRSELPKPVISPYAVDVQAQSLPQAVDEKGVRISGRGNFNYLTSPGSILRDLTRFREIAPFTRVHILTDGNLLREIPEIPTYVIAGGQELGLELIPVPVDLSGEEVLARLPADTQAVYITPLLRIPSAEFDRLLSSLIARGLPTFSLLGEAEVRMGVLAGIRPATDVTRVSRRIALNIQRVLLGEDAGKLPVVFDQPERMFINLDTARDTGVYPPFTVTLDAITIPESPHALDGTLTLAQAVQEAVSSNLSLRSSVREVTAAAEEIRRARSRLLPQLDGSGRAVKIDADRAAASFGSQPERTLTAGLSATQLLYSDRLLAGVQIARSLQESVEVEWEIDRLDVALQAASAFLGVLRAQTLERVERENLRVTETNLDLARKREQIGFSGPADVYRWESELATDKRNLIVAHNGMHRAFLLLNRTMNRPLQDLLEATPPRLEDPALITGTGRLQPYVNNLGGFELFREFAVQDGLSRSLELQSLDARIAAQERSLTATRRSYWAADVALQGNFERDLSRSGAGSGGGAIPGITPPDREDWSIALQATLPLFAGGERKADRRQAGEELSALRLRRRSVAEQIELRIRLALYEIASTFPSIELTREAADAAARNLELVTDSYSRGVVTVIDLLDAQNAANAADQFAANAIYDFFLDLMELQRATNNFDFFSSERGRQEWFERLERFFVEVGGRAVRPPE